jgi:PAS domain S-box-containing protein
MPSYTNLSDMLKDDLFKSLMSMLPLAAFVRDNDDNVVYVNDAWQEITGHQRERGLGRGWMDLLHPDDRRQLLRDRRRATANQTVFQAQHRFVRPDASIVHVVARVVPMPGPTGIIGYFGCFMDVSGLIQQQKAVTSTFDQISKALSSTNVTVSAQDLDLKYLWMDNPPWMYRGKEVTGHKANEFLPVEIAEQLDSLKRKVIAANSPARQVLSAVIDGQFTGREFFVRPTHNHRGEVDGVLTTAVDVTDILSARAELEQTRETLIKVMDQALDYTAGYHAGPKRLPRPGESQQT